MNTATVYFPSLNGIRAIAASMVIVHHVEMVKSEMNLSRYSLPGDFGTLGVTLFFVLSGFLITYLLLTEQHQTGVIHIRNFYIRRILRIWPLYYLIVGISFFLFSRFLYPEGQALLEKHFGLKLFLNLFLMANVSHACVGKVPLGSNLWSVGTEEQFYLIWPWLVRKWKKHIVPVLILIILLLNITRVVLSPWVEQGELYGIKKAFFFVFSFLTFFRIDCMAMGALGAWVVFYKKEGVLKWLYQPAVQWAVYAVTLVSLGFGITYFGYLNHIFYALFFILIIINLSTNPRTVVSLENKVFDRIGKISYGMYVYHFIAVVLVLKLVTANFTFSNSVALNALVYAGVFGLTLLISQLSYRYFELPILKFKKKFTAVISGDDARKD